MRNVTNERREKQLGMSWGKAGHTLRQQIMFSLVQATNRDTCIKCGKQIEKWTDLSIEHIKQWLDVDIRLYWDLDNIGFSHRKCNKPDRRFIPQNKRIGKDGEAWCTKCRAFKEVDKFSKNPSHWNGFDNQCRQCRSGKNHWRKVKSRVVA